MTARELLEAGRLTEALNALNESVRTRPTDATLRIFLFELLCLQGALDRAARQLEVLTAQARDPAFELGVRLYRQLLDSERVRQQVFHHGMAAAFLAPPSPSVLRYAALVRSLPAVEDTGQMLAEAEEASPAIGGRFRERSFSHFRDADDRLAPVLEVHRDGKYYWLPLHHVKTLSVPSPQTLRELIWVRARVELHDGSGGEVFVPVRYVDSHTHANELVRLGRMTEWEALSGALVVGMGQRVFLVDDEEVPLLELGTIEFDRPREAA